MANLIKYVDMKQADGTVLPLEIADGYVRDNFVKQILVTTVDNCPDCIVWTKDGVEEQGKLTVDSLEDENKRALYIIPIENVKGEESSTDNDFIEYYVVGDKWERFGGTVPHTVEDKYVRALDSDFDESVPYFVNNFEFVKQDATGEDVYKLVIGARNYNEDVLKTFKRG